MGWNGRCTPFPPISIWNYDLVSLSDQHFMLVDDVYDLTVFIWGVSKLNGDQLGALKVEKFERLQM